MENHIIEFLQKYQELCEYYGLEFRNIDGQVCIYDLLNREFIEEK
ncbi:hypothetical protein [Sporosarcina sp. FSL W7-1283]